MAKTTPYRFYSSAEVLIEELPVEPPQKVIKLRFRTNDVGANGQSPGTTPWVTIPVFALRGLLAQLASVANTAENWEPGQAAPSTDQPGITSRVLAPGVEPD